MTTTYLSDLPLPEGCVVVFDLDDTLCPERDFVRSGFQAVADLLGAPALGPQMLEWFDAGEKDAFGRALRESESTLEKGELSSCYREHVPTLELAPGVRGFMEALREAGHPLGLMTDGRSLTQRNKIKALGIEELLDEILISEEFGSGKPEERNFRHFEQTFPGRPLAYIGDNIAKDFVTPNRLGWLSVCLLNQGWNIHPQDFDAVAEEFLPTHRVERLARSEA